MTNLRKLVIGYYLGFAISGLSGQNLAIARGSTNPGKSHPDILLKHQFPLF
jgi:hypothetical protein